MAIIGPNGSGKTTLIKMVLGLVKVKEGEIRVNGTDVKQGGEYRIPIGYMPQITQFPEQMRVKELFKLMIQMRKGKGPIQIDDSLYRSLKIDEFERKNLGDLSGGMKQKVSAALAFYFNPDILILDEPNAGLDPISNEILKKKIADSLKSGKLIIISSHLFGEIDELCNHMVYLMNGKIHWNSSLDELKKDTREDKLNNIVLKLLKSKDIHD